MNFRWLYAWPVGLAFLLLMAIASRLRKSEPEDRGCEDCGEPIKPNTKTYAGGKRCRWCGDVP